MKKYTIEINLDIPNVYEEIEAETQEEAEQKVLEIHLQSLNERLNSGELEETAEIISEITK